MTGGSWRPQRAAALTLVTVVLAVGAHAAAGGMLPSPWVLLALTVPTACGVTALTRRRRTAPTTLLALGSGQLGLHEALALGGDGCTATATGHHAVAMACGATAHHDPGTGMLLAHVLATLLTGLLLARGEQLLGAVLARLAFAFPRLRATTPVVRPRLPRAAERRVRPRLVDARVPARRGPPALARATA